MTDEERTIYQVAFHLRTPVYKLVQEMPYDEFQNWCAFFKEFPPPDESRADFRAAMIMKSMGFKGDPGKVFPSLVSQKRREHEGSVASSIPGSYMQRLIESSVGGERIPL